MAEKRRYRGMRSGHGPQAILSAEHSKDFKASFRGLFHFMGRDKWLLLTASICAAMGTLLSLAGPELLRRITDTIAVGLNGSVNVSVVELLGSWLIGLYLTGFLFNYLQGFIMAGVAQRTARQMRQAIADKLNRIPLRYFDENSHGDVLSRVTNDADSVGQNLNNSLSMLLASLLQLLIVMGLMFWTNVWMAAAGILVSIAGVVAAAVIVKRSTKAFRGQQQGLGDIDGLVEETYTAHVVVRSFNGGTAAREQFVRANDALCEAAWRAQFMGASLMPLMIFVGNLSYVVVCVLGAVLVMQGQTTFGTIVAFMLYVQLFMHPLEGISQAMASIQTLVAAAERVLHFLQEPEMASEPEASALPPVRGDVVFSDVCFSYIPGQPVLQGFTAHVQSGQKAAIVGATGAGKTTLVNLLQRFYELDAGDILIDGHSIHSLTRRQVHGLFAMVLQDTWIFEGTVRENILYNRKGLSEKELWNIVEAVGLRDYVEQLPQGLDTLLDESVSLSAGQRQLMTIARAMAVDAPLLILDEATSSVDTRTEFCVQQAMDQLMKGRTSFVIAHRLSTIRNADIIFVLQDGNVVESGSHEVLLAHDGLYAQIYHSQFEAE